MRTLFGALRQRRSYSRATSGNLLKDLVSPFPPREKVVKGNDPNGHVRSLYRGLRNCVACKERVKRGGCRNEVGRGWRTEARDPRCAVCISFQRYDCVAYFVVDAKRESRGIRAYIRLLSFTTFICRAHFRLFLCPISPILPHLRVSAFSQPYEGISDTVRRVA